MLCPLIMNFESLSADNNRLTQAIHSAKSSCKTGIGRLSEKTLHSVLKYYFEPDETKHEIKIAGYYADIANADGIYEIQTASFGNLRPKLQVFLPSWPVHVIYPIAQTKYLSWVHPESGEITPPRKSPKKGSQYEIAKELVFIKPFLQNPNLTITAVLLDIEEYKLQNGFGKQNKFRASKYERIPLAINSLHTMGGAHGFSTLLPPALPSPFSTKDYAKAAAVPQRIASMAVNILKNTSTITAVGKNKNLLLYEETPLHL